MYESSEEELVAFLRSRGTTAKRWTTTEFEQSNERTLPLKTDIWLAEGSATFTANDANYSMQPGDTLHLPAGTILKTTAGMSGCVYYEAQAMSSPVTDSM